MQTLDTDSSLLNMYAELHIMLILNNPSSKNFVLLRTKNIALMWDAEEWTLLSIGQVFSLSARQ